MLSPFLIATLEDVMEFARWGALSELLYADHFLLMSDAIKGLGNKVMKS